MPKSAPADAVHPTFKERETGNLEAHLETLRKQKRKTKHRGVSWHKSKKKWGAHHTFFPVFKIDIENLHRRCRQNLHRGSNVLIQNTTFNNSDFSRCRIYIHGCRFFQNHRCRILHRRCRKKSTSERSKFSKSRKHHFIFISRRITQLALISTCIVSSYSSRPQPRSTSRMHRCLTCVWLYGRGQA